MKTKSHKSERRSLNALDGLRKEPISLNMEENTDTEKEPMDDGIQIQGSIKKSKQRRSLGGKIEKRKSSKFSKISIKALFSSNQNKTSPARQDQVNSGWSEAPCATTITQQKDQRKMFETDNKREDLNRTRDAGHTPKHQGVLAVNPKIVLDLIEPECSETAEPAPNVLRNSPPPLKDDNTNPKEADKKASKKKSKREPWRRKTIALFCGIRRKDPTSTGSDSPFENGFKENLPFPVRRSTRISTSTPLGITEAIAKVDSLVLSNETPITRVEPADAGALVPGGKQGDGENECGKGLRGRQYKSAAKGNAAKDAGNSLRPQTRRTSMLNAMADNQLVTMDANGSMHINQSACEHDESNVRDHSILSNLSKYKIKGGGPKPADNPTTPTGPSKVTTRRRKLHHVSQPSLRSGAFDKSLNLSDVSGAMNQSSWLEKSLSEPDPAKVTRSKSVKRVTLEAEKVEVIKKGKRRSVSLKRRISSIRKREEDKPTTLATSNRLDAGHTPRVNRKKEKPIDERLI